MVDAEGKCTVCGSKDFTPGGACRTCNKKRNDAYRKKHGARVKEKKAKKAPTPKREKLKSEELVLPAAWGIKAHLEYGFLQVVQEDAEGNEATVMLSRAEFRALIDRYGAWAAE